MWLRALAGAWVVALGYWVLRSTVLSVPDYCPDRVWDPGPPECDFTTLDMAFFIGLPVVVGATCIAFVWWLGRRLLHRRRLPD